MIYISEVTSAWSAARIRAHVSDFTIKLNLSLCVLATKSGPCYLAARRHFEIVPYVERRLKYRSAGSIEAVE